MAQKSAHNYRGVSEDHLDAHLCYELLRSWPAVTRAIKLWKDRVHNLAKIKVTTIMAEEALDPWTADAQANKLKPHCLRRLPDPLTTLLDYIVCFGEFPQKGWTELPRSSLREIFVEMVNTYAGKAKPFEDITSALVEGAKKLSYLKALHNQRRAEEQRALFQRWAKEGHKDWKRYKRIRIKEKNRIREPVVGIGAFQFSWRLRNKELAALCMKWFQANRPEEWPEAKNRETLWLGKIKLPYNKRTIIEDLGWYRLKKEKPSAWKTLPTELLARRKVKSSRSKEDQKRLLNRSIERVEKVIRIISGRTS